MARPRDPDRDDAILVAVRELLDQVGFNALTVEAVAERAGVGRPTVYRRWPTKARLVVAAFQYGDNSPRGRPGGQSALPPDTGSLRGDLATLVDRLVTGFTAMERSGAMGGITAEMATDVAFADELRARWLDPDQQALAVAFDRAAARGEIRHDLDGPAVLELLAGMVLYRRIVLHQPCPPEWQRLVVDLVLHGIT